MRTELNDQLLILDATDQKLPLGLLPERAINDHGRIIYSKEKTEWISLQTDKKDIEKEYLQITLNPDYTLSGKRVVGYDEYGAYKKRQELERYNSDKDYISDCESGLQGLKINSMDIQNKDDIYSRLQETWTVDLSDKVEVIDDLLLVNLNLFERLKENPFKMNGRVYPVNYPYCLNKSQTVILQLPDGYEVSELPTSIAIGLPENGGKFIVSYSKQGNSVAMTCKLDISKELFLPQEYAVLKEFYTQIVNKEAEPLILKKL